MLEKTKEEVNVVIRTHKEHEIGGFHYKYQL